MILSNVNINEEIELGKLRVQGMNKDTIRENGLDLTISSRYSLEFGDDGFVDLHNQSKERFVECFGEKIFINPKEFILLSTREFIELPPDIMAFCAIRSTIARSGLIAPPTIVDCGFHGALTIEIFNASRRTIILHEGDRFLHVVLSYTKTACDKPYHGLYQNQKIVTGPKTSVL